MGYKIPKKIARMTFQGTDYDGAEVMLRLNVPMSFAFEMQDLGEDSAEDEDSNKAKEIMDKFCEKVLLSWNLEDDDDNPIPATAEGMMQMPPQFFKLILSKWSDEITSVPDPLDETSSNGSSLEVDMMDLANSSQNLGLQPVSN